MVVRKIKQNKKERDVWSYSLPLSSTIHFSFGVSLSYRYKKLLNFLPLGGGMFRF